MRMPSGISLIQSHMDMDGDDCYRQEFFKQLFFAIHSHNEPQFGSSVEILCVNSSIMVLSVILIKHVALPERCQEYYKISYNYLAF